MAKKKPDKSNDPPPKEKVKTKGKPSEPPKQSKDDKPTRGIAIGENFGWTGKLPMTLLYEHCQRQKWLKPTFETRQSKDGVLTIITLQWENPKTKELIKIRYNPKISKPTSNESRHTTATYCLYRINFKKNMKMVLPVIFRSYWDELEAERKTIAPGLHDLIYSENPFQSYLDNKKAQEEKAKQREKKDVDKRDTSHVKQFQEAVKPKIKPKESEKISPPEPIRFSKKAWDNSPIFDIHPDLREQLEEELKNYPWPSELESSASTDYVLILKNLGFKDIHINECLKYTGDLTDSLEWLIFYLPTDELPESFKMTSYNSPMRVTTTRTVAGFSNSEVKRVMADVKDDMVVVKLTQSLVQHKTQDIELMEWDPDFDTWDEELESLKTTGHNVTGTTIAQKKYTLKLYKPSQYPNELPGLELQSPIPNYTKRKIITDVLTYIVDNQYLGTPMVYAIIDWLDENWKKCVNNPGPLYIEPSKNLTVSQQTTISKRSRRVHIDETAVKKAHTDRVTHKNHETMISQRSNLPAWGKMEKIQQLVTNNKIVLVTGETGSGKSTQVVQFIIDSLNEQGDFKSTIFVTQPRRISVLGLSDRVSEERCGKVGQEVGYIIRGDSVVSNTTRITFVTTGVLIRMLNDTDSLKNVKYIIVDEVHERSVDSDFLLMLLKRLQSKLPKLKIVLMSATIDKSIFDSFFHDKVGHIHIEGRTFPIDDYYLDDVIEKTDFKMIINGAMINPRTDAQFFKTGQINYDLIVSLVEYLHQQNEESILVFLPGVYEINQLVKKLQHIPRRILPLHSGVAPQDQKLVFKPGNKVVVSTNIAETSITISDCTVVIDSGRVKVMDYVASTASTKLVENWCSKSEALQRRGRAGRVKQGKCFKLYTKDTYELFKQSVVPEITRINLDNLYLMVKSIGIDDVETFLMSGIDSPSIANLKVSYTNLNMMGCLKHDRLTSLGKSMSLIPTDLVQGKLIIYGSIFGCVENCIIIAAVTTLGSPFMRTSDMDLRNTIKGLLALYSKGNGDLIGYVNLFKAFKNAGAKSKFIKDNYLSFNAVKDIMSTISQYRTILNDLNFKINDRNSDNMGILKAIITAAYYPRLAKVSYPDTKYVSTTSGSLEVDADAKLTKYFIRNHTTNEISRVFVHPGSTMFSGKVYNDIDTDPDTVPDLTPVVEKLASKPPFMVYGSSHMTSKLFINELTPTSCAAVIVFGNDMMFDISTLNSPGIVIDGWSIRAWCKNAVVAKVARFLVERAIEAALNGQTVDILSMVEKLF